MSAAARERFFALLRPALTDGTLVKLTLGKPGPSADPTLRNLFIRPVTLKRGPHLAFVWRHDTRDIAKNHPPAEALTEIDRLVGTTFLDAHLFTPAQTAQLTTDPVTASARLRVTVASEAPAPATASHDRIKSHLLPTDAPWLRALGLTNDRGQPRAEMAAKLRQIQKFAELFTHLATEAGLTPDSELASASSPLRILDAGCGKGYLTFALAALLGPRATITGLERRPELVALCNRLANEIGFAPHLQFIAGDIPAPETATPGLSTATDILIALHACDTATDDALAAGINANARLLLVSPCCQKELRPQLTPPPVLQDALRHGIFQERQAEFATDALRALLLEWAGYRTQVFEFVSTEHTAKNLMIAAVKGGPLHSEALANRLRAFAAFYGITHHRLATHLGFPLRSASPTHASQTHV